MPFDSATRWFDSTGRIWCSIGWAMNLYEVKTIWPDDSYIRAYVWARSELQARELSIASFDPKFRDNMVYVRVRMVQETPGLCTATVVGWPV
jgi:hypothetical protein